MDMTRYGPAPPATTAPDWRLDHVLPPSALFGANGMRVGPDRRLYVAQAFGSQISAIDTASGACEVIAPVGGPIVAPDDLAFDSQGTLYATEVMSARVSARTPDGRIRVIADNVPAANGVTVHQDRIFMDECRPGGRLFELYADGRAPRVIAENLPLPNALSLAPDGHIYFPAVANGEVWRVPVEGGTPERVLDGLATPTAVKIDRDDSLITTQAGNGEILRVDLKSGARRVLAHLRPGIDNFALSEDGRLFVSHFTDGGVAEILADGTERVLVPAGLIGPMGLAVAADGTVYAADGMSLVAVRPGSGATRLGMLLQHGFPGFVRGIALDSGGVFYLSNTAGQVAAWQPGGEAEILADGLDQPCGVALAADGAVLVATTGDGRLLRIARGEVSVLARGLERPTGVAVAPDGACYVSETGRGRVIRVEGGGTSAVLENLSAPHGLAAAGGDLFVLDRGAKTLHRLSGGTDRVLAENLPVGLQRGITPQPLPGIPGLIPGPLDPFAGLAVAGDGTVYIAGDGEGSLLALRPGA